MILNILIIIVSIVAVIYGADKLTTGSVGIAERMGLPQIMIGLTIVAMGTSMPEFCISLISALKGISCSRPVWGIIVMRRPIAHMLLPK